MKINVSICSGDKLYCEKLVNYFSSHYYDKFQWNVYTQTVYLQGEFATGTADIILVGEEMRYELQKLDEGSKKGKLWAYLVEDTDVQQEGVICLKKYRRADQIYRDLLDLYAKEGHAHYESMSMVSGKTTFIAFVSAGGGNGASTIACATAKALSRIEKVLYLNLEDLGSCEKFFSGECKLGLDELVYAVKSRRNTLELKAESSVSRDDSGTYYYKECTNPMDLQTLSAEDIKALLQVIEKSKNYDKVIIDLGNGLQDKEITVMSMANRIVMVMVDNEIALHKLQRYLQFVQTVEEVRRVDIASKVQIYYNKILKSMQIPEQVSQIRVKGAFPLIENGDFVGVIDKISKMDQLQDIC